MEYYDIIIIGAGIAGCGLAYNLKRMGFPNKILIIDEKGPGSKQGYIYRNTTKEIIQDYNLPFEKKFSQLNIGELQKIILKIPCEFYFIDYQKVCKLLLKRSNFKFKKEKAIAIKNKMIKTNHSEYRFKYLIDCSGSKLFLKKKLNQKLPSRYFIGDSKIFENKKKIKDNSFYFMPEKDGFIEDIYFLQDKIINGWWKYVKNISEKINPPKNILSKIKFEDTKIIKKEFVVIPAEPVFPIARTNYAFLGDSFGNATPAAGEGVKPILVSSKILAKSIIENNLKKYEIIWKNNYLNLYYKSMAGKINMKKRLKVIYLLKDYPEIFLKIIKNEKFKIPREIMKKFEKSLMLKQLGYYFLLKLKNFPDSITQNKELQLKAFQEEY